MTRIPGTGGNPPMRIDQLQPHTVAGAGPAPQGPIFIGRYVVVYGSLGGLFVYDGTPAKGNPPVFSVVAPGTTTDPYGNAVKAVMNAGDLEGAHFGIDDDGNAYLADSTGATRIYLSPINSELAFYTANTASVLLSVAPSAITDPLTEETVQSGFNVYGQGTYQGKRAQVTLDSSSNPTFYAVTGASDEASAASWTSDVQNGGDSNQFLFSYFRGPANSNRADYTYVSMQSSADNLSGYAGGNLGYNPPTGTETILLTWGEGGIFASLFDGSNYDICDLRLIQASTQTFSSTSPVPLDLCTDGIPVQAGTTYVIRGVLFTEMIGGANSSMLLTFSQTTATITSMAVKANFYRVGSPNSAPGGQEIFGWNITSLSTDFSNATAGGADQYLNIDIDGSITFDTAGTLYLSGYTTSSENWNLGQNSYISILPVIGSRAG